MSGVKRLAALNLYVGYVPTLPDLLGGVPSSGRGGGSRALNLGLRHQAPTASGPSR
jgi:hypothetical protein